MTQKYKMPTQIEHRTVLDGIILIFQRFEALIICKNFSLPNNVNIKQISSTYFRESTLFSGYTNLHKISYGVHNDMPVEIVIAFEKPTESGSKEPESFERAQALSSVLNTKNLFSIIRTSFFKAINFAAKTIGCWDKQCCKTFEDILKRKECNCFGNRYIDSDQNQVTEFSNTLLVELENELIKILPDKCFDVFFTARDIGQNVPYSRVKLILDRYKFQYIKELLVHCSRDYWVPGKALLWKTDMLRDRYGKPYMEFFPGLLRGHGNLYYRYKHKKSNGCEIKMRKFYHNLFKGIHKYSCNGMTPFSKPMLQTILCEPDSNATTIIYQQWIECLESSLKSCIDSKQTDNLASREEIIFSSLKPSKKAVEELPEFFKQACVFREKMSSYYSVLAISKFMNYINNFMRPLMNCIKEKICEKVNTEVLGRFYAIDDDQLRLACACEAVIAFSIYGTALWRSGKPMFPKELRDELGLDKKYFERMNGDHGDDKSTWRSYCIGLQGLKNISIVQDRVECKLTYPLNRCILKLLSNESNKTLANLLKLCHDPTGIKDLLEKAKELLLEVLIRFNLRQNTSFVTENFRWEVVRDHCLPRKACHPVTPKEYCDWLFSTNNSYYHDVLHFLQLMKSFLPVPSYIDFAKSFCGKLEESIYENCCMLVVPKDKDENFAVLPLFYNSEFLNDNQVLVNLAILFKKMYSKEFLETEFRSSVHKLLNYIDQFKHEVELLCFLKQIAEMM